jgi:hypothetical protein
MPNSNTYTYSISTQENVIYTITGTGTLTMSQLSSDSTAKIVIRGNSHYYSGGNWEPFKQKPIFDKLEDLK